MIGVIAAGLATPAFAADETSAQGSSFDGRISAVNKEKQTITVGGESYQLLPTTRIKQDGQNTSSSDLAVGQRVDGRFKRSAEGNREVLTLDIAQGSTSAVGAARERATTESGASFRGRVDRINLEANRIRIDGQTYHVLPTTVMTRAGSGNVTKLSDLRDNQFVSGTYKQSQEGRREILSIEVGRDQQNQNSNQNQNRNQQRNRDR